MKNIMQRLSYFLIGAIAMMILTGCLDSTEPEHAYKKNIDSQSINCYENDEEGNPITIEELETSSYNSIVYMTFEEAVLRSNSGVIAEFISVAHITDDYVEFEFHVNDVIYGNVPEQTILLREAVGIAHIEEIEYSYSLGENVYTAGQKYILVMQRHDSLFYDYPIYVLSSNIIIPLDDIENSAMYGREIASFSSIDFIDASSIIQLIKDIRTSNTVDTFGDEDNARYTDSDAIAEIAYESDIVLEVLIESLFVEGHHNGNTYISKIINVLKGGQINTNEDDRVFVVLMKGSVEIGQSYIVILNRVGEHSLVYTQSSMRSVISPDDAYSINELNQALEIHLQSETDISLDENMSDLG